MNLATKAILVFLLTAIAKMTIASYEQISDQVCNDISNQLPAHESELRVPQAPSFPLVSSWNIYTWESTSCHIDSSTLTDKNHDIVIKIDGRDENGDWVGIDTKVSCLFTSDYEWTCLYSEITHNVNYTLHFIQVGLQYSGLKPSQQDILSEALSATRQYF